MNILGLDIDASFFLLLATAGLAICVTVEQAQLLLKYRGLRRSRIAGGYNDAMKIMVLNRLGTVLYFLFIALAIDLGTTASELASYFVAAFLIIAVSNIFVVFLFWKKFQLRLTALLRSDVRKGPVIASFFAATFGMLGLTVPMLLSAGNPALRLTLANTGFLFNSVFTIITVFFVESYLAKLIDGKDNTEETTYFVALVSLMRLFSAATGIALMLAISLNASSLDFSSTLSLATSGTE